jgi:hypothetical protein
LLSRDSWIDSDYLGEVVSKLFETAPREAWQPFEKAFSEVEIYQQYGLLDFLGQQGSKFDEEVGSPLWSLPDEVFLSWIKSNVDLIPLVLEKISLYTNSSTDERGAGFQWHPYAVELLKAGVDEQKIEQALHANLYSFGSTGSRVPYLEKRLRLLQDLIDCNNSKLKRIGETVAGWLREEIQQRRREELNESARFQ